MSCKKGVFMFGVCTKCAMSTGFLGLSVYKVCHAHNIKHIQDLLLYLMLLYRDLIRDLFEVLHMLNMCFYFINLESCGLCLECSFFDWKLMSRLVAVMGGDHCVTVSAACLSHRSLNIQVSKKQNVSFTRDLSRTRGYFQGLPGRQFSTVMFLYIL